MLHEKLQVVKKEIVEYGVLIETMVRDTMQGLLKKDATLLEKVLTEYEPKANATEIDIDEHCTALIAQFQPKARDLRAVLMILGMNKDLERMGDHCVNIAQSAQYLIERPAIKPYTDLTNMGEIVSEMLQAAINALVYEDTTSCKAVCERDDAVDELRTKIVRELISYMTNDSQTVERALHILRISGNLERIADLTTNLAEEVMYMANGHVMKHHHE